MSIKEKPMEDEARTRFGERLRGYCATYSADPLLQQIADAIDLDAEHQSDWMARTEDNRIESALTLAGQKVREAVERLRYCLDLWHSSEQPGEPQDVLDVEPFMAELDRIFDGQAGRALLHACQECGGQLPYGGHVATPLCDACLDKPATTERPITMGDL